MIKNNTTKKMTVKEFIKKYNALTESKTKIDFVKMNIITKYVPYEQKVTICENIVDVSYYVKTKDINGNETKKIHINSTASYMLYRLNIVNNYTSINIDFKNSLEDYNSLNKSGLLDIIFYSIPDEEIAEFDMILEMVKNDFMQNKYETHAFISSQVERFAELFGLIISPGLENLGNVLTNMDDKKIEKVMSKFEKLTGKIL